jgi:gliding motility-associated-like protein
VQPRIAYFPSTLRIIFAGKTPNLVLLSFISKSENILLMRLSKFCCLLAFGLFSRLQPVLAQTIIFSDPGATYANTDDVTTNTYGPANIANCTSISFSINYNFSLPFVGAGNMESSDECPFGIPPCEGDPTDPSGGGCAQCWDFLYVQFQIDGVTVNTQLVGVPGSLNQSGTLTYGPICTGSASTAGIIVQTQTWAANESVTFSNITITCWDGSASNVTATPNPVCAGLPFALSATLTDPAAVTATVWSGPGTVVSPNALNTNVNNAPVGTNTYSFTTTDDNACTQSSSVDVVVTPGSSMDDPANQTVCSGDQVDVVFTGTGSPEFNWTNTNTAIGLGASGAGNIGFTAATVTAPITGTITVTPSENGCVGPNQTFTVTVNPLPSANQPTDVTVCAGAPVSVILSGSTGATFGWSNDNTAIGLGASGMGNISFNAAGVANQEVAAITVIPIRNGCQGPPVTFNVTVNPLPTVVDPPNQAVCAGSAFEWVFSGTGNPNFNWTNTNTAIGLGASGSGDLSFTATNLTNVTSGNIIVTPSANGCTGPSQNFTITVNPLPTVNQPTNITVCAGTPVTSVFSGTFGSLFSWTNDNPTVGLAASGTGNIIFNAAIVSDQEVANIAVTPVVGGCPGSPMSFTVTVNPLPTVTDPINQTVCSGTEVEVVFSGNGNADYNWTNSNTAIGLATSGSGNINFTAATVAMATTGNLVVTPTENGCTGTPQNFTLTVTPAPTMNVPSNVVACAGTPIGVIFTGSSGASFNWMNSNTNIGLSASGNGDLSFIAAGVSSQQIATITVMPTIGTCSGTPVNFTITVNPAPTVVDPANQTVCSGTPVTVVFSGTNNPVYSWTNTNTAIGLASSGTGGISFTASSVGVGTITVVPTANGCTGLSQNFDLSVIGSPMVNQPVNLDACAGNPVAVAFSGTSGASFSWTNTNTAIGLGSSGNGDVGFTASAVGAETSATISVTPNLDGCTGTALNFDIVVHPLPTLAVASVICSADLTTYTVSVNTNGTTVTATAGTVIGSAGNYAVSGIAAGTNVTITSLNTATGCQVQQGVNAPNCNCTPVNPPVTPNDPVVCEQGATPELTVTVDPGNTVDWYSAPTGGTLLQMGTISFTPPGNFSPGVYSFYAEAREISSNCTSPTRLLVTLTVVERPFVTQIPDLSTCAGSTLTIDFVGTPSAAINWVNNNTAIGLGASGTGNISFVTSLLPASAYLEVIPTLNGCAGQLMSFFIIVKEIPTVLAPTNETICAGQPVSIQFSGANGATYAWTNSETAIGLAAFGTGNINFITSNVVAPTLANLTVTPLLAGCIGATQNFSITVNPAPIVFPVANQSACAGSSVAVNFSGSNGATFEWTNSNSTIGLGVAGTGNIAFTGTNLFTTPLVSNVVVTPFQNGCSGASENFSITVNPRPTLAVNSTTCSSDLLTYSMSVTSNATTLLTSAGTVTGNTPNFTISNIPNGTNVVLTATNTATTCSQQQAVAAPNCTCPTVPAPNSPNFPVICEGTTTPALMVNVSLGHTVDWYATPTGGTPLFVGSTSFTPVGVFAAGSYIFYAESREVTTGCTSATRTPVFLTVNAAPTLTQPINQSVCAGFVISIGFNGTNGAVFNWTNSNPAIGLAGNGAGNISFSSVNPGAAPVTATIVVTPSLFGCVGQPKTFTITVNPAPTMVDPADVSACVGQSVAVNFSATNGATFTWINANANIGLAASGSGNINFTTTNPGNAMVTVIPMANGCSGSPQTFNIAVINNPMMNNPGNLAACAGANVSVVFTGDPGLTYSWTNSNPAIGLGASGVGNLSFIAGNVTGVQSAQINVKPLFGACFGQSQLFTITINPPPLATISGLFQICKGDAATLTAAGGTGYSWSTGPNTATISVSPTTTSNYTVTVTANGCTATTTATVKVNQPTTATVSALTCNPAQVGSSTTTMTNAAGCDSIITTITLLDVVGCTPTASLSNGSVSCFGSTNGTLSLSAAGGLSPYQYAWTNGAQMGNGLIPVAGNPVLVQGLSAGTYTVTVTGANGLTMTVSAQVTSPALLTAQTVAVLAYGQYALSCNNASDATVNGSGAGGTAPYNFAWDVPGQNMSMLSGVGAGTYTLTLTDAHLCSATSAVTVSPPPPFAFGIDLSSPECGSAALTALITPTSGASPFQVLVDGVPATGGLSVSIAEGVHLVALLDDNGCLADSTVQVVLPLAPYIVLPSEVSITLGETLIVEAYTNLDVWQNLLWNPLPDPACPNCLRQEWIPDASRVYEVVITDNAGCSATSSVQVLVRREDDIFIPNVFSPNDDGIHDWWYLDAGNSIVSLHTLQIYDRWGDMVYSLEAPMPVDAWHGWDGRAKGKVVNPGVFVYYLEYQLINGETVVKKGDVTVVR